MKHEHQSISLGFTDELFSPGVHICQIFSEDDERTESLLKFLLSGLQGGEKSSCFSERIDQATLSKFFESHGFSYDEITKSEAISLAQTREVYFENNCFEPERMLNLLKGFYFTAQKQGFSAARVIGEMIPEIENVEGGSRLLEYESKVSLLLEEYPVTAVCQYDARLFDGATIMDVLKVHPLMLVKGSVVHNPFYIPPMEFLSG